MRHLAGALLVIAGLSVLAPVGAAGEKKSHGVSSVRQQVESSMLVKGDLSIEADGSVSKLQLEQEEKLPTAAARLVREAVAGWRFEPTGSKETLVTPMSLRVVARKLDDDRYEISMQSVSFQRLDTEDPGSVASIDMTPPRYPREAIGAGASGDVYLLLKVGRDGRVEDAFAEQVNLRFLSNEGTQRRFRQVFADSSIAMARRWTFRVPSVGARASQPFWVVRVPVSYSLDRVAGYGAWVAYVRGPRERSPWYEGADEAGFSPDALAGGGVYMADHDGPHLLTPLHEG